ncbi:TetR family transcriptional regulator [Mucilaginibacter yixingensis]|uniref:TetR family transcriptional regulator n=1 Tax=Mucilaginibacter yixingensis TaxID=1295612 RepID=A0A2T5J6G8_9SPHI|nr:TetR/AcrR family transcriptional regulator [Mucilaginibacter yixingensis]PTQ94036.1 TetR family transcriptional regulator [Mucilaginibacter yixingensis]
MEKPMSKSERTRQFIIERTAPIFNTKGYEGTSMNDMTEATGLTKGSIYGNFANKQEVALAVFDYNHSIVRGRVTTLIDNAQTYTDKLLVYVKVYHSFSRGAGFIPGGCPILNTAIEADDTNPPLRDRAAQAIIRWKEKIVKMIEGGIEAGEFKPDVDKLQTAVAIIALIEGGVMIGKVTNSPSNLDRALETVEQIILALKKVD